MRFLVDECTGPVVARWLKDNGHVVFSVYDECRGWDDSVILDKAYKENYILITNDKGFGTLIFQQKILHHGVILLRLDDELPANKIDVLKRVLLLHGDLLQDRFTVASEKAIRIS
jgi:predicted nuclease of predicted toxin-antitoxin system